MAQNRPFTAYTDIDTAYIPTLTPRTLTLTPHALVLLPHALVLLPHALSLPHALALPCLYPHALCFTGLPHALCFTGLPHVLRNWFYRMFYVTGLPHGFSLWSLPHGFSLWSFTACFIIPAVLCYRMFYYSRGVIIPGLPLCLNLLCFYAFTCFMLSHRLCLCVKTPLLPA